MEQQIEHSGILDSTAQPDPHNTQFMRDYHTFAKDRLPDLDDQAVKETIDLGLLQAYADTHHDFSDRQRCAAIHDVNAQLPPQMKSERISSLLLKLGFPAPLVSTSVSEAAVLKYIDDLPRTRYNNFCSKAVMNAAFYNELHAQFGSHLAFIYDQGHVPPEFFTDPRDQVTESQPRRINLHCIASMWDEAGKTGRFQISIKFKQPDDKLMVKYTSHPNSGIAFTFGANDNACVIYDQLKIGQTFLAYNINKFSVASLCNFMIQVNNVEGNNLTEDDLKRLAPCLLDTPNTKHEALRDAFIEGFAKAVQEYKRMQDNYNGGTAPPFKMSDATICLCYDIKRSMDSGQCEMVNYLNNKMLTRFNEQTTEVIKIKNGAGEDYQPGPRKEDVKSLEKISRCFLITGDRLCFMRAKIEGIPAILLHKPLGPSGDREFYASVFCNDQMYTKERFQAKYTEVLTQLNSLQLDEQYASNMEVLKKYMRGCTMYASLFERAVGENIHHIKLNPSLRANPNTAPDNQIHAEPATQHLEEIFRTLNQFMTGMIDKIDQFAQRDIQYIKTSIANYLQVLHSDVSPTAEGSSIINGDIYLNLINVESTIHVISRLSLPFTSYQMVRKSFEDQLKHHNTHFIKFATKFIEHACNAVLKRNTVPLLEDGTRSESNDNDNDDVDDENDLEALDDDIALSSTTTPQTNTFTALQNAINHWVGVSASMTDTGTHLREDINVMVEYVKEVDNEMQTYYNTPASTPELFYSRVQLIPRPQARKSLNVLQFLKGTNESFSLNFNHQIQLYTSNLGRLVDELTQISAERDFFQANFVNGSTAAGSLKRVFEENIFNKRFIKVYDVPLKKKVANGNTWLETGVPYILMDILAHFNIPCTKVNHKIARVFSSRYAGKTDALTTGLTTNLIRHYYGMLAKQRKENALVESQKNDLLEDLSTNVFKPALMEYQDVTTQLLDSMDTAIASMFYIQALDGGEPRMSIKTDKRKPFDKRLTERKIVAARREEERDQHLQELRSFSSASGLWIMLKSFYKDCIMDRIFANQQSQSPSVEYADGTCTPSCGLSREEEMEAGYKTLGLFNFMMLSDPDMVFIKKFGYRHYILEKLYNNEMLTEARLAEMSVKRVALNEIYKTKIAEFEEKWRTGIFMLSPEKEAKMLELISRRMSIFEVSPAPPPPSSSPSPPVASSMAAAAIASKRKPTENANNFADDTMNTDNAEAATAINVGDNNYAAMVSGGGRCPKHLSDYYDRYYKTYSATYYT